jgi:hypothetical protein
VNLTDAGNYCLDVSEPIRCTVDGVALIGCSAQMDGSGQLKPDHSRWLMGFPSVWCDCAVMAMQSYRMSRRRSSSQTKKD